MSVEAILATTPLILFGLNWISARAFGIAPNEMFQGMKSDTREFLSEIARNNAKVGALSTYIQHSAHSQTIVQTSLVGIASLLFSLFACPKVMWLTAVVLGASILFVVNFLFRLGLRKIEPGQNNSTVPYFRISALLSVFVLLIGWLPTAERSWGLSVCL